MKTGYGLIFLLLSCCIIGILCLQAYWIMDLYQQKKEGFDRNVYEALSELNEKLMDRRNLQDLKMTYFIQDGDTIAKTPSRNMSIASETEVKVINENKNVETHRRVTVKKTMSNSKRSDSLVIKGDNRQVHIYISAAKVQVLLVILQNRWKIY
jgi:Tfp pilus assembly protein PilE